MSQGKLLWEPSPAFSRKTNMRAFLSWLEKRGQRFGTYDELWGWSVDDLEGFWGSIWKYFEVSEADYPVLAERKMPGAKWFDGSELNFTERVFRHRQDGPAIISKAERKNERTVSWQELEKKVGAVSSSLRQMGVGPGDRVAAYLPNSVESVVAFLATASLGGVWSCCSPDFGAPAVVDRFSQIEPKVLIAADGYSYGGKWFDRTESVASIMGALPTLQHTIGIHSRASGPQLAGAASWDDISEGSPPLSCELVPFDHPLWVLYSSGTTGLPKPIVHDHGGIVVELYKALSLHNDVRPGDRFFWFTTTGWMMWNYLVGGLLHGATIVLYSGSPSHPSLDYLWDLVDRTETAFMGGSAAYFASCMKAKIEPRSSHALKKLRGIGSTGSPLSADTFEWVYSAVKEDLWLASMSGGTDVCTAFVGGCPTLPVYSGEIQCRALGAKVEAYDDSGNPVLGQVGELVITEPMPSMPVYLWGDSDGSRYMESYFGQFPGVWRHGDWIEITKRGTCIIFGRSDATIKRLGVRIGTSEIYRSVESLPEVADSMAIDLGGPGDEGRLVLFITPSKGFRVDPALAAKVRSGIKRDLSPRYVPDEVMEAPSIPRTLNGKKLEVPIKRILAGGDPAKVLNRESVSDPASIDFYIELAKKLKQAASPKSREEGN